MSKTLAIVGLELRQSLRDRGMIMVLFFMPVLFATIIGLAVGGMNGAETAIPVALVVEDDSAAARFVADGLAGEGSLKVEEMDLAAAKDAVGRRKLTAAVVIPAGFGERLGAGEASGSGSAAAPGGAPATVQIVSLPGSAEATAVGRLVEATADRLVSGLVAANVVASRTSGVEGPGAGTEGAREAVFAAVQDRWADGAPVTIQETAAAVGETLAERTNRVTQENRTYVLLGMTMMFLMMSMNMGMGGILQGKKEGTWQRLMVSPTARSAVLGGKVISQTILAWVQVCIMMGFGSLVFGLKWGATPLSLAVIITAFILAANGLGLILATVAKTPAQLNAVAPIIITATSMLGGCYWPVEAMPSAMQAVARFIPQSWAMSGLRDLTLRGVGLSGVLVPVAVLLGFAALFFSLGLWRVAKTENA